MEELLKNKYLVYTFVIVVTLLVSFLLIRILRFVLNRFIKKSSEKMNVDPTKYKFLKNAVSFIVIIIALLVIFYSIPEFKALGVSLFAGAGILAVIIGLSSQQAFSNIISGVFMVIFKPFSVGDTVRIGLETGVVEDITLRHTVIKNFENRRIIIPNSVISTETIKNSTITDEKICNFIEIGISYDSDIDKAIEIIQEEAMKHTDFLDNRSEEEIKAGEIPAVRVRLIAYGESSLNLRAYVWAKNTGVAFAMKCDLLYTIKKRFDESGIEIPYPYRNLVIKNKNDQLV